MTHVEFLMAERSKYIKDGKEKLETALSLLEMSTEQQNANLELTYLYIIHQAETSLIKASAVNDLLNELGVPIE